MANIIGTTGDDDLNGTSGDDDFDLSQGGKDIAHGLDGNDLFEMEGAFTAGDQLDGGPGNDTLLLGGDYSAGLTFHADSMANFETLNLSGGFDYNFTVVDANVAAGVQFSVNGGNLSTGSSLRFDGSSETDGTFFFQDGGGDDILIGGGGNDTFILTLGGADRVNGGAGNDVFLVERGDFSIASRISGGTGNDIVEISDGLTAHALVLGAHTLIGIEELFIDPGHNYKLTMHDGNVARGGTLTVNAYLFAADQKFVFDGSAETQGSYIVSAGAGNDVLTGGAGGDTFDLSSGGNDTAHGGDGDDTFQMFGALNAKDRLDGGAGNDILALQGDYDLSLRADTIQNIETLTLLSGPYHLKLNDGNVKAGQTLTIDGSGLSNVDPVHVNGAAETDGTLVLIGSTGADIFRLGSQANVVTGGFGIDKTTAGHGVDTFVFGGVSDSTGVFRDTISGINFNHDRLDVTVGVAHIDAEVTTGALSRGSFNSDLQTAINSGNLHAGHAVLFQPDHGNLQTHIFLIVDANGLAGYQADADYVIDVTGFEGSLGMNTFI